MSLQPTVDVRCSDEAENPVALFGLFVGLLGSLVGCMAFGLVSSLAVLVATGLSCWNATLKAEKAAGWSVGGGSGRNGRRQPQKGG